MCNDREMACGGNQTNQTMAKPMVIPVSELPKAVGTAFLFKGEAASTEQALKMLGGENDAGLNRELWKVLHKRVEEGGLMPLRDALFLVLK